MFLPSMQPTVMGNLGKVHDQALPLPPRANERSLCGPTLLQNIAECIQTGFGN